VATAKLKELDGKRLELVDHAVERGLVSKRAAEDGVPPGPACPQLGERFMERSSNGAPDPDLVVVRLPAHARRFAPRLVTADHKGLVKSGAGDLAGVDCRDANMSALWRQPPDHTPLTRASSPAGSCSTCWRTRDG
jgi:hypothetical protein